MKPSLPFNPSSLLAVTVLFSAITTTGLGQTQPASLPPVSAEKAVPDEVATGLMHVPIYNFAVHNVAFSPDGKLVATGDGNGVVRLWEAGTGKLRHEIKAHKKWAFTVAWAKDGKSFVTGGWDDLIQRFEMADLTKPAKTFTGHDGDVHAVVITSNERQIISAGDDKQIMVWDIASGKSARQWPAHEKAIPTLALSPDGKTLASGSRDHAIKFWNPKTGELRDTLIGHTEDVMSVRFSPDGKLLASASYDTTVRLWNAENGKAIKILHGHTNRAFGVSFSPNGKRLASAGDSTVRLWNVQDGAELKVISFGGVIATGQENVTEHISSVAFSPDGKLLAAGSTTGRAFLVSPETGNVVHQISEPLPKQKE